MRALTPLAVAMSALALISCVGATGQQAAAGQSAGSATPGTVDPGTSSPDPAAASPDALPNLTPAQKAGQRVIYSYNGLTPPATLLSWIRHGLVGGVIFFGGNISSRTQIAGVIKQLDRANASTLNPMRAFPLLLMTDQEGGAVRRLPGQPLLSAKQIGQSAHPATAARAAGTGAGKNLAGVGMNVNLAPVLDVGRPGSAIRAQHRSFGGKPGRVIKTAIPFATAMQRRGVAATAKHFPGLGGATVNTDDGPATITRSAQQIRDEDLAPFRAAIAAGVPLVMAGHATYPAIDPDRIASQSPNVIDGLLRHELGYKGVVITDSTEAAAVQRVSGVEEAAIRNIRAGVDIVLTTGRGSYIQVYRALLAEAHRDPAFRDRVRESAARVAALQRSLR